MDEDPLLIALTAEAGTDLDGKDPVEEVCAGRT